MIDLAADARSCLKDRSLRQLGCKSPIMTNGLFAPTDEERRALEGKGVEFGVRPGSGVSNNTSALQIN